MSRQFWEAEGREGSRLRAVAAYVGKRDRWVRLAGMASHLRRDFATLSLGIGRLEGERKRSRSLVSK
jgi:hypothetical protein